MIVLKFTIAATDKGKSYKAALVYCGKNGQDAFMHGSKTERHHLRAA